MSDRRVWLLAAGSLFLASSVYAAGAPPRIVAHRGLLQHAPENTLANFRSCLELGIGLEVDVRRSQDGRLVCIHDDTVERTTNGRGPVAGLTLAQLRTLDAGSWFDARFRGERIPTFDEVLAAVAQHGRPHSLVAVDLKERDIEAAVIWSARCAGVLDRLLFIGNAINSPDVRRRLRQAAPEAHVACLAQTAADLPSALADASSDWAYLRFVPSPADIERVHAAKKRAFLAGPTVAGLEHDNWRLAAAAGVDGLLTDYPLELAAALRVSTRQESPVDQRFAQLVERFIDEFPALSPVSATTLGDHRYDDQLDDVGSAARQQQREFVQRYLDELGRLQASELSRAHQVDYRILAHHLRSELWSLDKLQEWAWNPLIYTQLAGGSIYGLMARDFAPVTQRLQHATVRLEQLPRLYEQVRATLVPARVPGVHAETAIKQNRGVLSTIEEMIRPQLDQLPAADRERLNRAIATATQAVETHQEWLEQTLLPQAQGDFRLGPALYDEKLAWTLGTRLTRQEIRERAEFELRRVRAEMYAIARRMHLEQDPQAALPEAPTPEEQQRVIAAGLERAYAAVPPRDGVVAAAQESLKLTTEFVRSRELATIPPDPLDIIVMPEFQRGVSVAYCDAPGPLEVGQKTFYAVAPLPEDWSDAQCASFLREYNLRSIHNLTIHEAMPGHFLQLAHANRHPQRLRSLLSSGVFVEGWACYTEQMLSEAGFLSHDPAMRLVTLKWYLRSITNAILDQSIHVDGIRREDALRLMMHDAFQEEREAAGKWTRAQLTSAQLSTYFVGYQEHRDLRAAAQEKWGGTFSLKRYHDGVLSHGSPAPRFVRALLLDEPIPE